jgi:hypothetical protein
MMRRFRRIDVGNVINPTFTVGCRIAKRWLAEP